MKAEQSTLTPINGHSYLRQWHSMDLQHLEPPGHTPDYSPGGRAMHTEECQCQSLIDG